MRKTEGYKKLNIYRIAHELALKIHKMSLSLPKFEMYEEEAKYDVHRNLSLVTLLKDSLLENTKMNTSVIFLIVMLLVKKQLSIWIICMKLGR